MFFSIRDNNSILRGESLIVKIFVEQTELVQKLKPLTVRSPKVCTVRSVLNKSTPRKQINLKFLY